MVRVSVSVSVSAARRMVAPQRNAEEVESRGQAEVLEVVGALHGAGGGALEVVQHVLGQDAFGLAKSLAIQVAAHYVADEGVHWGSLERAGEGRIWREGK